MMKSKLTDETVYKKCPGFDDGWTCFAILKRKLKICEKCPRFTDRIETKGESMINQENMNNPGKENVCLPQRRKSEVEIIKKTAFDILTLLKSIAYSSDGVKWKIKFSEAEYFLKENYGVELKKEETEEEINARD